MIVIRTRTHVTRLTGEEITAFLLHPSDREYQRWWEGTHLELHPVKGSGQRIGDIVYMDELVGRRRIRLSGVLVESIPGRKITWQFKKLVKLPAWLSLELEDDDRGVTVTHSIRAGFEGIGRILDPIFRVYLSEKFARAMDDPVPEIGDAASPRRTLPRMITASTWAERLHDQRSGRVVFLSHCLLNENTRYLGGAGRRGSVAEIVQPCLEQGIGIVQLPCPEEHAWGGVLKRWLLGFYGADASLSFRLRGVLFPLMLFYTRRVYRRLARQVANQIQDYLASGFQVLGIIGVDGSPSCGVQTTMNVDRAFAQVGRLEQVATVADVNAIVRRNAIGWRGLFVAVLPEELIRRGLNVPFAAHDLMAELEGRRVVSAFDSLTSTRNDV